MQRSFFIETPNGPIVVVEVAPQLMMDEGLATRLRQRLSHRLGGAPVVLRSRVGDSFWFNGDQSLWRYAVDPIIEVMQPVEIEVDSLLGEAA